MLFLQNRSTKLKFKGSYDIDNLKSADFKRENEFAPRIDKSNIIFNFKNFKRKSVYNNLII